MKDAYTAGLFDGEGTVTMTKRHRGDKVRAPAASMTSTTIELVDWMLRSYGGYKYERKPTRANEKVSWCWRLVGDKVIPFLELIVPWLKEPEKIRRTKILINEWSQAPKGKLKPLELEQRLDLEKRFFAGVLPEDRLYSVLGDDGFLQLD